VAASDAPLTRGPATGAPAPGASLPGAIISSALLAAWIGWQMGWAWAAAGIVGLLVHELGHLVMINLLGCGPGRIHFIPFLGGAATMSRPPNTEFKGVLIALAGPLAGLLAAVPFIFIFEQTDERAWLGGIYFIGMINLINLAPAPPLDGSKALGPALARIHPWLERGALFLVGAAAVGYAAWTRNYLFSLLVGLSLVSLLRTRPVARPTGERLTLVQWLASVGLWMIALALCLKVVIFARSAL
jgi:Zn-dependent protease